MAERQWLSPETERADKIRITALDLALTLGGDVGLSYTRCKEVIEHAKLFENYIFFGK